ncbi:hypothetical protein CLTEP_26010 [Clostridium tepidiprofundi DSM 19306]|uniref:FG-GAP repeat protein n=1 Tax=Clostridium tepidiprofundi DSM 19306 TaxID=1121338 RepID=A0A151ASG1_9CLOT|nr:VCBS repeat-containing protein [Clostridium tepidiprofundi]KYH30513.1 hypothetical protein CLTEP_26010 [Clostridium tepidiprofundi DSM 19306]
MKVKKKYIFSIILIVALILIFINTHSKTSTIPTFSIIDKTQLVKVDMTGDGYKDILYITSEHNNYYVQIKTKNKNIELKPSKKHYSLGKYYSYWQMRTNLKDITGDNIPEIFIQSSLNNKPIQAIFVKKNKTFENIFYSSNNILGFLYNSNDFISANYINGKIHAQKCMFIDNNIKSYKYNMPNTYMGLNIILDFIDYVENIQYYDFNDHSRAFCDTIDKNSLKIFSKLKKEKTTLTFQDAIFMPIKNNSHKNNSKNNIKWILNFRGNSKDNYIKNYTFTLYLTHCSNKEILVYKISNIECKNKD